MIEVEFSQAILACISSYLIVTGLSEVTVRVSLASVEVESLKTLNKLS